MLKILHTADWHVGKTLAGWSRMAEHRLALAELVAIAADEAVDAVIIAGDVFDTQSPKAEAEQLVFETIGDLRRARPQATIVMIAGNHDLAGRIEAPSPLYRAFGVHAVGGVMRKNGRLDLDRHLVPLAGANGTVLAHCLALPYFRAVDLPGSLAPGTEEEPAALREIRRLIAEAVIDARALIGGSPLLATGHLTLAGGVQSRDSERAIVVGGQDAVPADIYPTDMAYVALGHLHRPQAVGRETVRYAGSLFPLSASERDYAHGVTIVEIGPGTIATRSRPISRPAPFLRLPEHGAMTPEEAEPALRALILDETTPSELRPFVQLSLRLDGPRPSLESELDRIAEAFPIRLAGHIVERNVALASVPADDIATLRPLAEWDPADLFRQAFEKTHGQAPEPAHRAVFDRALAAARGD